MNYSKNPIIDLFLHLTVEEGKAVRGVALSHCPDSNKSVIFSIEGAPDTEFVSQDDTGSFNGWWRDTSDLLRRLRRVDMNPLP